MKFKVGERIIVHGITYASAKVRDLRWIANEHRWCITLEWSTGGTSKVYDSDENRVWYRYCCVN